MTRAIRQALTIERDPIVARGRVRIAISTALADVIRVDDSWWSLTIRKGEPVPGGAVKVTIGPPVEAATVPLKGTIS